MELGRIGERVRERVYTAVRTRESAPTSDLFRNASESAARRTRRFGAGAGKVAVDAVSGAIKAADEISGEATEFVRDAVIGVVEGTGQVARVGRPVVKDVVSAAVRSSTELGGSMPTASQRAVEGAIVGAASVGVESGSAVVEASAGVVEAVRELGGDFEDIVAPAIHGVIIGVIATSGDLFEATRETSSSLVNSGAKSGEDVAQVSRLIVSEAAKASRLHRIGSTDAVMGAAQGCVEAAYELGPTTGDLVRRTVQEVVDAPVTDLAPSIRMTVTDTLGDLSEDLRARPQAWRGVALWNAAKSLVRVGGLDIGAALAYYMLLAFFPLVALIVLGFSTVFDPETIRDTITHTVVFYFPSSEDFIGQAIDHLFEARLAAGLIAFGAIVLGAQGLFMATNRGVNRVFGCEPKKLIGATVSSVLVVTIAVLLFLLSVGSTVVFQIAITTSEALPTVGGPLNRALVVVTGLVSAVAPFLLSGLVFVVVYRYLPNEPVRWSDATFGGLATMILFEVAKHIFFWFGNVASQRSLLYGSLSSVIIVLIWSHVAGIIFLYGASLTKQATDLRPKDIPTEMPLAGDELSGSQREADIALGRVYSDGRWREARRVEEELL